MSDTEAAASLFGTADSPSDLFTALGTESSQEASDGLFDGASADKLGATNAFYNVPEQRASTHEFSESNQSPIVESCTYAPTRDESALHGTYSSYQQWNGNQTNYGTGAGISNGISYDANKYAAPATHDPYALPQNNAYVPASVRQPPAPKIASMFSYTGNQASTYDSRHVVDPYAHQHLNQSTYNSYDLYTPMSNNKTAATTQQRDDVQQVSSHAPHIPAATVPIPSAPMTTQVPRPKVSNAYDPPFSAVSYARRNVPGPVKYGQGYNTFPRSAYAPYQPTTSPPLTPPPPPSRVPAVVPAPFIPTSQPTVSPPPPPSKLPDYTSAYIPPSVQNHTMTYGTLSSSDAPSSYASAIHPASVPSTSTVSSEPTTLQNEVEGPFTNDIKYGKENALADEPGLNFFHGTKLENFSGPGSMVEEPAEMQSACSRAASPSTINPLHESTQLQSPSAPLSSSLQQSFRAISPPRTNIDSGRVSSPRQSPRPPSSPVHVVSYSGPRASPDLRRESLIREYIPRSKTTSPGTTIVNPYVPPPRGSPLRAKSASMNSADAISSPDPSSSMWRDRYAPRGPKVNNVYESERTGSPSSFSSRSSDNGQHHTKTNHLPSVSESPYTPAALPQGSVPTAEDQYVPFQPKIEPVPLSGDFRQSQHPYSVGTSPSQPPAETITKPTVIPYAPSPSLVGANDPLGRTSVRVPVISFGFGGKIVTCFHHTSSVNMGYAALSPRVPTNVQVQSWKKLVPESTLDSLVVFPGPLHADPGPPSTGIIRTGAITQAKMKKTSLIKYLSDRTDEMMQGLNYLHNGSVEKRTADGKLVLVKLLRIMVENDGRVLGTPQLDSAVRTVLVPRLEVNDPGTHFTTTADTLTETPFGATSANSDEAVVSVTALRGAALDKIEEFLLRGERHQAYHYALDEKLWAHAMVIASSIDKEAWKEVVNEFIRADLGVKCDSSFALHGRTDSKALTVNGREGLRVAYSLFSGQGAAAVQELVPKNILARGIGRVTIPAPTLGPSTPRTPNLAFPVAGAKIPTESLVRWAETVAMLLVSPLTPDTSAALTSLGDQLLANGWLEAAHVCFLLSPQTSPVGGIGNPAARIILLGSKSPVNAPSFSRDPDTIIFTEILEYIMTMVPLSKGQEPNNGFPHLQAYRLIRAYAAAEIGDLNIANRYCEAITASLVRGSVYFTPTMLEQLKNLADRLSGVSHPDKTSSWIPGKIPKPSLDTFGGWLEGRFTKLVTGESDSLALPQEDAVKQDGGHGPSGPFTHYNTISSATNSARSSPAPPFVTPAYALPPTGSAMSNKTSYSYGSVTDLVKRNQSPGPTASVTQQAMPASVALPSTPSIQTQLGNHNNGGYAYTNEYGPGPDLQTPKRSVNPDTREETNVQEVAWWGSFVDGGHQNNGKTPVAKFEKVEGTHGGMDNEGFFSPMTNQSFVVGSKSSGAPVSRPEQAASYVEENEEDDLGLGNSSRKERETVKGESSGEKDKPRAVPVETNKSDAPASNSGWFSRWWGRKENTSGGPVKANLGEESSFYYDKELKRWVNKKAEGDTPKTTPPPPPPPRAQTASPGRSVGYESSTSTLLTPPPPSSSSSSSSTTSLNGQRLGRPGNAADLTTSPPPPPAGKPLMRVRSNLAPPGLDSAPPTPMGTRNVGGAGSLPPTRPKSSSSQKKSVRSRYVDVFAGEGSAA